MGRAPEELSSPCCPSCSDINHSLHAVPHKVAAGLKVHFPLWWAYFPLAHLLFFQALSPSLEHEQVTNPCISKLLLPNLFTLLSLWFLKSLFLLLLLLMNRSVGAASRQVLDRAFPSHPTQHGTRALTNQLPECCGSSHNLNFQ